MISPPVLVCTALVFAYLTGPAADMRETWGPVAEKSRKWLAKITKTSAPKVGEETPASWASTVPLNPSLKGLGNAGSNRYDARWNAEISRLIAFCIERRNP